MVGDSDMQRRVRKPSFTSVRSILILVTLVISLSGGGAEARYRAQAQITTENNYAAYLPLITVPITVPAPGEPEFNTGYVESCAPNAAITYVHGTTAKYGTPVNGQMVAFSYEPDGPIVAKLESGPHPGYPNWPNGFFSHILGTEGPREGDWHFWIVDSQEQRISVIINLHTDGWNGVDACQQAVIRFDYR